MKLFGIDITINFSSDLVDKYDRYQELRDETDAYDDDENYYREDENSVEHQAKLALIGEQTELYYDLKEEGLLSSEEDEEPEQASSGGFFG